MLLEDVKNLGLGKGDQIELFYKGPGGISGMLKYFDHLDEEQERIWTGEMVTQFGHVYDIEGELVDDPIFIEIRQKFVSSNYSRPEFNAALNIVEKIELNRPANQMGLTFEEKPEN